MKKIKGLLFAFVALFAFTLVMVTAKAETETIVTNVGNINATSVTVDGIEFTCGATKNASATANSIIDGTEKSFTIGAKLNGGGYLKFTASYAWSARLLIGSGTAGQSVVAKTNGEANGTVTDVTANTATAPGIVEISNGQPGEVIIERAGSKEMWIFELVLTQTKNLDAEYVDVYFHDVEGNEGAANTVEKGATVTAKAADPILGKKFEKWTLEDGTEFDFATPINEETHLYPVYSDLSLNVADANVLSRSYLSSLLGVWSAMPTITERTEFVGTNYALASGAGVINNDTKKFDGEETAVTYGINTNGKLGLEEDVWKNAVEFNAPSAGTLKIYGRSGNSNQRALSLTTDNTNFVTSEKVGQDEIALINLEVAASGTYYLGCKDGGFKIYSIEFEAAKEASVELYQERVAVDAVENIRLVAVVENVDNLSDLSLVLKCALFDADMDLTEAAKLAATVTNNDETYSIGEISFEAKDGVVYIKCVIAADSKYVAETFTAELTVGGITKTVTINALA
ncbi:MAG: hypothetical protein K2I88_06265 [Anaeroplasmataceae bacterium]|nr:hypothetical protein [Anaeroplasmataceae bacterium]